MTRLLSIFTGVYVAPRAALLISLLVLTSCRLVIITDETGHIVSASGQYTCESSSCAFPITEPVTETFTAIPAEGYRFSHWRGVCRRAPIEVCRARVFPLPEKFKQYDGDIQLIAIFESNAERRAWYRDSDGDEYGSAFETKLAFERPEGFVGNTDDCNDSDAEVRPWAKELNDGQDNDCDGEIDEGFSETRFHLDADSDGFGDPDASQMSTTRPEGYVRNDGDCDDGNPGIHPDAREVADGWDNDCDGEVDEGGDILFRDVDGDGFGRETTTITSLEPVNGYVENALDCDDNNDAISPAAREEFDSVDNDCDGEVDEGFTVRQYFRDIDGDGYGDPADVISDITRPTGYVGNSRDNCVEVANPRQTDSDGDGIGDACDPFTDTDRDGIQDSEDNCPGTANAGQGDLDGDGVGDACDSRNNLDNDGDGINDESDNCPGFFNPGQVDTDSDGLGDACDAVDDSNSVGDGSGGDGQQVSCGPSSEEQGMLEAVNAFRSEPRTCGSRGSFPAVSPLTWRCELKSAALTHSMDMANNNFFSHTGSDGSSAGQRITAAGYSWSAWGENIAAGIPLSGVSAVMQAWIDSPGHCANLMGSNFSNFGAAKYSNPSSDYDVYWTQVFGRPR